MEIMSDNILSRSKTIEELRAADPEFRFSLSIVTRTYMREGNAILQMEDGVLVRVALG